MGKKSKAGVAEAPASLSGFLLAQAEAKDVALEDIFANSVRSFPILLPVFNGADGICEYRKEHINQL